MIEALRWKKFPVLDDGFVCLVDVMGDDQSVVQAARVSYGGGDAASLGRPHADPLSHAASSHHALRDGRVEIAGPRADGLLAAMDPASHGLGERDEHAVLDRHRHCAATPPGRVADAGPLQPPGQRGLLDRGGRGELSGRGGELLRRARRSTSSGSAWAWPASRPAKTCRSPPTPRRIGRSTCTTCSTFLQLRMDPHAQWEIRQYAKTIGREIVRLLLPLAWEAFEDYRLGAISLSRLEQDVIGGSRQGAACRSAKPSSSPPAIRVGRARRSRERDECRASSCGWGSSPRRRKARPAVRLVLRDGAGRMTESPIVCAERRKEYLTQRR